MESTELIRELNSFVPYNVISKSQVYFYMPTANNKIFYSSSLQYQAYELLGDKSDEIYKTPIYENLENIAE